MSNKIKQIQLKRSNKTLQQLDTSSTTLLYGEPLVLPGEKMLVIGDSDETNTVSNDLAISITSSELADKVLYYNGTNILDSSGNTVTLPSNSIDQSSKLDKVNPEGSGAFKFDGNEYISGDVYVNSNLSTPAGDKLATQLSITAEWSSGSLYKVGSIVYYQDKLYRCIQSNTASNSTLPTNTNYWVTLNNINIQDLVFSSAGDGVSSGNSYNGVSTRKISYNTIGAASSTHTHNYAGSSSVGGASTQLNINSTVSGTYYILGAQNTGAQSVYRAYNASGSVNNSGIRFDAATGVLYGAAWNDFAEFRKVKEEPGTVVCEFGNGHMFTSNSRLLPGAAVISDTFGMVVGEESEESSPIAVAGRVLAKINPKETYDVGDCVCSGENGTISPMTRREIRKYPDRIVGIVSEIPDYEEWNGVKVNNRIWIKVR